MSLKTSILLPVLFLWMTSISETPLQTMSLEIYPSKFSLLSKQEQIEALEAFRNGDCTYKDIQLYGKVTSFPDFTVRVVTSFPDLKVKQVESFPGMD